MGRLRLMSMEWARTDHSRGFIASWPQFGVPCGLFLSNLAVFAFSQMSGDQFLAWGWRIPFALSLLLVGVGLYIRLGILETPIFAKLLAERKVDRTPMLTVMKRHPKEILLSAFARMAEQAPFYIFTAFIFSYGIETLHTSRNFLLTAVLSASILSFFSIPFFGHLSDRIGRKTMYMIGAVVTGLFGFAYFAMLNTGSAAGNICSGGDLARSARYVVRPAGRAHRGKLYRAIALQRLLARISTRVDHRGRPRAADRDMALRYLSFVDPDRHLHRALRGDYVGCDGIDDGLYRQGYFRRVRLDPMFAE